MAAGAPNVAGGRAPRLREVPGAVRVSRLSRLGVGRRQGRGEQDPVDAGLIGPAGGGQVGVGEASRGRADACLVQGLLLAQRPRREKLRRRDAENVISQVFQGDRVLNSQAVIGTQSCQERLRAEYRLFEVSRDAVTVRLHKVNAPSYLSMPGVWSGGFT
jgi:hypothetical protein